MFLLFYYQRWDWIQWSGLLCVNFHIKFQQYSHTIKIFMFQWSVLRVFLYSLVIMHVSWLGYWIKLAMVVLRGFRLSCYYACYLMGLLD